MLKKIRFYIKSIRSLIQTIQSKLYPILLAIFGFTVLPTSSFAIPVVTGYDYEVTGTSFASVVLPVSVGDGVYDLWLFDTTLGDFIDTGIDILGGDQHEFSDPVTRFSVRGIEENAMLDPSDPTAFTTGFTLMPGDNITVSQSSIVIDYKPPVINDPNPGNTKVPEPTSLALICIGLLGFNFARRKSRLNFNLHPC
ncbi:MAG: PEP-CTERM sorting domain-containing protein [Gammaproteobacteria bacterium]|nr:PEP-CTERM sorting domain-containing protein [Gammaproteobacteria bacterium]